MTKTFIAYRSTGEDTKAVKPVLTAIKQAFEKRGVEVYCTFFDAKINKSLSVRGIIQRTFGIIDDSDFLFVVQTSDNKSEGMLMEIGYCLAKGIPIVAATKNIVTQTHVTSIASQSFTWESTGDLTEAIAGLKFDFPD